MKKFTLFTIQFLFSSITLYGQGEANNWIFGMHDNLITFTDTGAVLVNAPPNGSGAVEFFFCGGGR